MIALNFVLPGLMGVLALVDPQNSAFWRVCFVIIAFGGAIGCFLVRGASTGDPPSMITNGLGRYSDPSFS